MRRAAESLLIDLVVPYDKESERIAVIATISAAVQSLSLVIAGQIPTGFRASISSTTTENHQSTTTSKSVEEGASNGVDTETVVLAVAIGLAVILCLALALALLIRVFRKDSAANKIDVSWSSAHGGRQWNEEQAHSEYLDIGSILAPRRSPASQSHYYPSFPAYQASPYMDPSPYPYTPQSEGYQGLFNAMSSWDHPSASRAPMSRAPYIARHYYPSPHFGAA